MNLKSYKTWTWVVAIIIVLIFLGFFTGIIHASENYEKPTFDAAVVVSGDCNGWTVKSNAQDFEFGRATYKVSGKSGVGAGVWTDTVKSYDYKVTVSWDKYYGDIHTKKFHDEVVEGNITKPGDCPTPVTTTTPTVTPTPAAATVAAVTELPATGDNSFVTYLALILVLIGVGATVSIYTGKKLD